MFPTKPFVLQDRPEIVDMVRSADSGEYFGSFDPQVVPAHTWYLRWQWIPTDNEYDNRLLLLIGCSEYSVNTKINDSMVYSSAALLIVSSVCVVGSIMALTVRKPRRRTDPENSNYG